MQPLEYYAPNSILVAFLPAVDQEERTLSMFTAEMNADGIHDGPSDGSCRA